MSHLSQAQAGLAAIEARKWDEAVEKLSVAVKVSPNPQWLIARSKALVSLGRFQEALDDADLAWHTAYDRNKRNFLSDAHYRRAVAYCRLKQYANADACCVYAMRLIKGKPAVEKEDPAKLRTNNEGFYTVTLDEAKEEASTDEINSTKKGDMSTALGGGQSKSPQAQEWRMASTLRTQILFAMEKLPKDDPARKLTTSLKPERKEVAQLQGKTAMSEPTATSAPNPAVKPPAGPLQLQDYQTNTSISVSIFSKGVDSNKLQVQYLPTAVILDPIIHPDGTEGPYRLDLWGEIDTAGSKHAVTPKKVELSLKKKTAGKWAQVKSEAKVESADETAAREQAELEFLKEARKKAMQTKEDSKEEAAPAAKPKGPSYPTSSKHGAKNWDAIAGADEEDDGSDVNLFFKKLYKGANPEQQRAMMKSFIESNGTTLSTDWNDVKDRVVETKPPAGVEPKQYPK